MAYLPKLNPTVGGGLGGLPERRATGGGASANSIQRSIIGQAVKGSLAYRNITSGDTYSLDPVEGLADITQIYLTNSDTSSNAKVAMFADGGFALAYTNSSLYVCIAIYAADGTQVLGSTVVETVAAGYNIAISISPTAEVIRIVYYQGKTSGIIRRAIYSKTGTLLGGPTTLVSGANTSNVQNQLDIDHWDDGAYAVGYNSLSNSRVIYYTSGDTVSDSFDAPTPDYLTGRLSIKCLSTADRTLAYTYGTAGGLTSAAGRVVCELIKFHSAGSYTYHTFLAADDGGTSVQRVKVTYDDENNAVTVFFKAQGNALHMTSSKFRQSTNTSYAPTKEVLLPQASNNQFNALCLGGDRYIVSYGGHNGNIATYVGIVDSEGNWISSPRIGKSNEGDNFYTVDFACSKNAGRCVSAISYGVNIVLNVYAYRNRTTELTTLNGRYPTKVADFVPWIDPSYRGSYSINANQSTNKFVLAYRNNVRTFTWAIYSSGGTILNGPYLNTAFQASAQTYQLKALLLPNGNVCLINNTGSNTIKFAIYDSSNNLQGSITTVTTTGQEFVAEVANNGNFCIVYRDTTGYPNRVVYTQTGTLVTSVVVTANNGDPAFYCLIYNSVSDNFFFFPYLSAQAAYFYTVFSSANVQVVGAQSLGAVDLSYLAATTNTDGTVSICAYNASNTKIYYRKLSGTGASQVAWTDTFQSESIGFPNVFQLLPISATQFMYVGNNSQTLNIVGKVLNVSNGAPASGANTFGIGSPWYEGVFKATPSFIRTSFSSMNQVQVTQSANGDKYVASTWGDVYRISDAIPSGTYVIDGVVNEDKINSSTEVITNGFVNRATYLPRTRPFVTNGTNGKKVILTDKIATVSS